MKQHLQKQQSENMTDLKEMDSLIDWSKQEDMPDQIKALRRLYGTMRMETEKAPGGVDSLARGVMILVCNVLMQGAETIEGHYADRLGDKNAR